ncbi:MAG: hypothetical protein ACPLZY_02660 [Candidatus Norongarragalinales archaeon]
MSEEKKLKTEGEELAKIAVDSGMGAKQLQTIHRLVKTRPLPYVEAYVQRQIGREVRGLAGFTKVLELLKKYESNKMTFEKVLTYAVMLYDYCEKEPTMALKVAGDPVIRRVVEARGFLFDGAKLKLYGRNLDVNVRVKMFYGNPKALATDIEKALKSKDEFASLNLKVWIESQ